LKLKTIIVSASNRSAGNIIRQETGIFRWIYLGENAINAEHLEKQIGERGGRIEIAGLLKKTAEELKQPYIDYIGELDKEKNSFEWWANTLSEKNIFRSKTFLYSCYVKIAKKIRESYPRDKLVFFVEKEAVRKSLHKNMNDAVFQNYFFEKSLERIKDMKTFIIYKMWFLLSNIYYIILTKYIYRIGHTNEAKPLTLIYTFINNGSFDENGNYIETIFGSFPDYAIKTGKKISLIPQIRMASYKKSLENIRKSKYPFLMPHAYLTFYDVIEVFVGTMLNKNKIEKLEKFEDIDINDLISEDLKRDQIDHRIACDTLLFSKIFKRLKQENIRIDRLIYPFENLAREKLLCITMRKIYPYCNLLGYQHSTISLFLLSHFFSKKEADIIPLPDKIITNGRYYKNLLLESGYPAEKVIEGGAIRYSRILERGSNRKETKKTNILITTSVGLEESAEIIIKSVKALRDEKEYKVIIKCHPFMPFKRITQNLELTLPDQFVISKERFTDLLFNSSVLLYSDSTTSLEAIAMGIPVIYVESDLMLIADKLDFNEKLKFTAKTPEEINGYVKKAISMNETELKKKRKEWRNAVKELFNPVNEETYRLFLK